jgi:uncharacterized membrane protein
LYLLGIAKIVATVLFCVAMKWLCTAAGLTRSGESWKVSTILFTIIYLIPIGLVNLLSIICLISGTSFRFDLGLAVLPLLIVFLVPVAHLFISTSRMKSEAASTSTSGVVA